MSKTSETVEIHIVESSQDEVPTLLENVTTNCGIDTTLENLASINPNDERLCKKCLQKREEDPQDMAFGVFLKKS